MGSWGTESCSNDSTWDLMGNAEIEDIHEIKQEEVAPAIAEIKKSFADQDKAIYALGAVIWILRAGLKIEDMDCLNRAVQVVAVAVDDEEYLDSWVDRSERESQLDKEIVEIIAAIENGGQGIKEHVPGLFENLARMPQKRRTHDRPS